MLQLCQQLTISAPPTHFCTIFPVFAVAQSASHEEHASGKKKLDPVGQIQAISVVSRKMATILSDEPSVRCGGTFARHPSIPISVPAFKGCGHFKSARLES